MAAKPTVYEQVITITRAYLGPAAQRFVSRQVFNHLRKVPEDLTAQDLRQLIDWIRIAVSLLTDESDTVEKYIADLQRVAGANDRPERKNHGNKR